MNTLTRTLAALGAALGLILGGATVATTTTDHVSWAQGEPTITTGCVVRFYAAGPAIHENPSHGCSAARAVSISRTHGTLTIDQTYDLPVVSVIAQADETLVRRGITAGVSGGVQVAEVTFYSQRLGRVLDLRNEADYRELVGPYSNLWFSVIQVQP